jgi:hypothetical protein
LDKVDNKAISSIGKLTNTYEEEDNPFENIIYDSNPNITNLEQMDEKHLDFNELKQRFQKYSKRE